jgi:pimeloyl-ACP methyl ester carboxylesterase
MSTESRSRSTEGRLEAPMDLHATPTGSTAMSRQLMIPAADTRLYAVDAAGGTPALLFLSGGFGTVQNWSRVIRRLDGKYRAVRFDARARGKSGRSADYSVQAAVDDIGRVIDATGIERPILVGWSHGATIAVRYAAQHPGRVGGLVLIDGAYPIAETVVAAIEHVIDESFLASVRPLDASSREGRRAARLGSNPL